MKIAILSTPWIAVPPQGYGGIELVVENITEGLVKRGHDVTLFATGDSKTSANLAYFFPKAVGNDLFKKENPYYILQHAHAFVKYIRSKNFDILHNNSQYIPMYFFDLQKTPFLHTLHGAFYTGLSAPSGFTEETRETLSLFKHHPYVSISNNQRLGMPDLNYIETIYNGIKIDDYKLSESRGGNLVWLGRITPNKGLDTAIKTAIETNLPLKVAFFTDPGDKEYFEKEIKPICNANVELLGQLMNGKEKSIFFENALATLFPIRWDEPFGLVIVESMACGIPVIAFARGSVGEIIEDGVTGFLINPSDTETKGNFITKKTGIEGMVEAVNRMYSLPDDEYKKMRKNCRELVEQKFSAEKMVENYEKVYEKILTPKPLA